MNRPLPPFTPKRACVQVLLCTMLFQAVLPAAYAVSPGPNPTSTTRYYQGYVSQTPGVYSVPPAPNVMFTLDDSGSMMSDVIPDFVNDGTSDGIPAVNGSTNPLSNRKYATMWGPNSGFMKREYFQLENGEDAAKNAVGRYLRSAQGNPLYYDPQIRYVPWVATGDPDDGVPGNANPASVIFDTETPTTASTRGTRILINLTSRVLDLRGSGRNAETDNQTDKSLRGFWPATYFVYKGSSPLVTGWPSSSNPNNLVANFSKFEIVADEDPATTNAPRTFTKYPARTDCAGATCSRAEERLNFANWLQYYHSRRMMAKGGVAKAFQQQGTNMRVGFAMIGKGTVVQRGVREFSGTDRSEFFGLLYETQSSNSTTPLRPAMQAVGAYFSTANPWTANPGGLTTALQGSESQCRRSVHIMSTDGYWNGNAATGGANGNADSYSGRTPAKYGAAQGELYTSDGSTKFGIHPFKDDQSGTLADVAAYYWKTDLRPDLNNRVPATSRDPAFWQHLTTFTIGFGISGTGTVAIKSSGATTMGTPPSLLLSNQANIDTLVSAGTELTWSSVTGDTPSTGDDLIHAAINGRGRYFQASDPNALATGLSSTLAEATDQTLEVAAIATESSYVSSLGSVYQSTFNPRGWAGRLYAFTQNSDGTVNNTPSNTANANNAQIWEASLAMPLPADRKIFTSTGAAGTGSLFNWASISSTQRAALDNSEPVLNYLRGDGTNELARKVGTFRDRPRYTLNGVTGGVLGDIVNSTPIKGPDFGGNYQSLPDGAAKTSYEGYREGAGKLSAMRSTLFVGANDGMLHGFNTVDGVERFAYVPNAVYSVPRATPDGTTTTNKLAKLATSGYDADHQFTVDGPPNVGDAYFGSAWRTMLVGSNGAGARGIFSVDVTNTATTGLNAFGTSNFKWEFTESDNADMGFVLAYPHLARMRNGRFAYIFGNGYDSKFGRAKLFIVDAETREIIRQFTVGTPTTNGLNQNNGLSQPNFVVSRTREVLGIYAGDLQGNLWKFNVADENPANWRVSFNTTSTDSAPATVPLFRALNSNGNVQPITVMPEISTKDASGSMVIVSFGTGKLFESTDTSTDVAENVNLRRQSIYGIWDNGVYGSNTLTDGDRVNMTANSDPTTGRGVILNVIQAPVLPSDGSVKFAGTPNTAGPSWGTQRGWAIDLMGTGERVNLSPQQVQSVLFFATNTPDNSDPCANGGSSSFFALNPVTGTAPTFATLDTNNDGSVNSLDNRSQNVMFGRAGIRTRAVFQSPPSTTAVTPPGEEPPSVMGLKKNKDVTYRGQTSGRQGGVELDPDELLECRPITGATMTTGMFDASIETSAVGLGTGCAPRISWRQLK